MDPNSSDTIIKTFFSYNLLHKGSIEFFRHGLCREFKALFFKPYRNIFEFNLMN
jgi:hypothetical protein